MTIQKKTISYDIKVNSKEIDKLIKKCDKVLGELSTSIGKEISEVIAICSSIENEFNKVGDSVENSIGSISNTTSSFNQIKEIIPNISSNIVELLNNLDGLGDISKVMGLTSSIENLGVVSEQSTIGLFKLLTSMTDIINANDRIQTGFIKNEDTVKKMATAVSNSGVSKSKSDFDSYADTLGEVWGVVKGTTGVFKTFKTIAELATSAAGAMKLVASTSTGLFGVVVSVGVGAFAALTAGLIEYDKVVNAEHYSMVEKKNAIKDTVTSMNEMSEASQKQMDVSLGEIAVLENYYNALRRNVDENGVYVGTKEQLAVSLSELNEAFPQLNAHLDEESQKIVDQNGEVLNLKNSIGELIKAKKIEAYLDAYQDNFANSMKNKNNAIKENIEYQKELIDIESKFQGMNLDEYSRLGLTVSTDAAAEYAKQFNLDPSQILDMIQRQNDLNKAMEENNFLINQANEETKEYESVLGAYETKDYDQALSNIGGFGEITLFDPAKGQEQISALEAQVQQAKETVESLKIMEENNPEANGAYEEQIALALENQAMAEGELQKVKDAAREQNLVREAEAGTLEAVEHNKKFGEESVKGMGENGQLSGAAFGVELTKELDWITIAPKYMDIYARYHWEDSGSNASTIGSKFDASFDDTEDRFQTVQANWGTGNESLSQRVLNGMQSRLSTTLEIGIPQPNIVFDSAGATEITQNLSFNQPIQKPSDISRALQKAARDLRKVK